MPASRWPARPGRMLFSKSSTRTRVSFEVGIRELGGQVMFLPANEIQLGRGEPIKDTARVLGRMVHGAVIPHVRAEGRGGVRRVRRHPDDQRADRRRASLPNPGGHLHLPGKARADPGQGRHVHRRRRLQRADLLDLCRGQAGFRTAHRRAEGHFNPRRAICSNGPAAKDRLAPRISQELPPPGADLLYTDVWVSMGKEEESAEPHARLSGYQINASLVKLAKPGALVMHCLPAYRGKEIDEATFEANAQTIFDQAENRLHVQKAILNWIVFPDGASPSRNADFAAVFASEKPTEIEDHYN